MLTTFAWGAASFFGVFAATLIIGALAGFDRIENVLPIITSASVLCALCIVIAKLAPKRPQKVQG